MMAWLLMPFGVGAQENVQLVLDTGAALGAVVQGHLTADDGQVVRLQNGAALEYRRFSAVGEPVWQRSLLTTWGDWLFGSLVRSGADGSIACSSPLLTDPQSDPVLELALLAVTGDGDAAWGRRLALGLTVEDPAAPVVRLIRASDEGAFVLLSSVAPQDPVLRVLKVHADGSLQWARSIAQGSGIGSSAWGDARTCATADALGGLLIARAEPARDAIAMIRLDTDGALVASIDLVNSTPYTLELYDMDVGADGNPVLLGRMAAPGLPSGGYLIWLNEALQPDRWKRYQFDIGKRLYVQPDNSAACMDNPLMYRVGVAGDLEQLFVLQNWTVDPHGFTRTLTSMEAVDGKLWMQGVLQKVLIQFNTQRLMPHFALHPLEDLQGCQFLTAEGFGFTRMAPDLLPAADPAPVELLDLASNLSWEEMPVISSEVVPLAPVDLCSFAVSVQSLTDPGQEGFLLDGSTSMAGSELLLRNVRPGTLALHDSRGRLLWSGVASTPMDRFSVPIPDGAAGMLLLHWTAASLEQRKTAKVAVF